MGVDAKLIVVCKEEEKMEVMEKILLAVEKCAHLELRSKALSCNLLLQDILSLKDEVYMRSTEMSTYNFRTFTIKFGIGDKYERLAFVHTTCECDVEDILSAYKEPRGAVLFSVGYWGKGELIRNFVAQELCKSFDVYVDYNDSDDVDYVKFQGEEVMAEKKFIVVPTSQIEQALRIPAMWAECVGDVKEAEEIAKELVLKHSKAYTVLYVGSTFKPEYSVKKEDLV